MARITQKQLVEQIKLLQEIKPRQEWASLLKSQILTEEKTVQVKAQSIGIMDVFSSLFFQRRLAYAFVAVLFVIVGVFGFAPYTVPGDLLFPVKKITEQSQAALTGHTGLQNNIATLNNRINDLSQVAKAGKTDNIPSAISEVNANVSELVKDLKNNLVNDPETIKDIVNSLKTLADVPGTDLTENPDVKDLYQTIVQSQIADLSKTTITEDQEKILSEIKELYFQGKYADALEKILLISK